ncbi:MarR family transcriptional regulator [Umezawaea sp. Da 62-37]|uniref:MarR family winged helix-turn-helix transcriptional regulator n=1 Tax=Umezawaea sp. Da 62-37 TaxID=3075927 RepID=UPI0028F73FC7|nr:MarR family transcriptional regulator [Umezawaea sp. Da 62-37]WNV88867.1 MarR family transcriptional regulator [Umezawaea sp. Da 62-37]
MHSAASRVEAALGLLLRRTTRANLYDNLVTDVTGVDETTYPVLSGIARMEPVSSTRLADEIGIDRTATTRYAARLEKAGLVRREADPGDARSTLLLLTPDGRSAIDSARRKVVDRLDGIVAEWTPLEAELFASVLEHLVGKLRTES